MNEHITVVAHITAESSWAPDVLEALHKAVGLTQSEDGCLYYQLFNNIDTANQWTMLERWRDEHSLTAHNHSEAFLELSAALNGKATLNVFKLMPSQLIKQMETVQDPTFWLGNGLP